MSILRAVLDQLRPAQNAPRWGAAVASLVASWLAQVGWDLSPEASAALAVLVASVIGTAVQKLATLPRG